MPEVSDAMGPLEWERWEQFCKTGRISDYLNYRGLENWDEENEVERAGLLERDDLNYRTAEKRRGGSEDEGESVDADGNQGGGALGQEYGGI